ncbi:MAG: ATP-binding protein [Pseudomonadota bacterium]|nr:ATP-binding protein [Pseudomonadota bacterium]
MVMGLPISNALASLHGSRLDISSTLIEGKTVVIYLPANENSA